MTPSPSAGIAAVVLAAGTASRMAGVPKQLLDVAGRPLLQHVVDVAAACDLAPIVVVLGYRAKEVEAALKLPPAGRVVVNPAFADGQAGSLRAGLAALAELDSQAAAILLGDQPHLPRETVRAALDAYATSHRPVVRVCYDGVPGHPVVADRCVWSAFSEATGDRGARDLLARHPELLTELHLAGPPPVDVDTPEAYLALRGQQVKY